MLVFLAEEEEEKGEREREEKKHNTFLLFKVFDRELKGFPADTYLMIVLSTPLWLHVGIWILIFCWNISTSYSRCVRRSEVLPDA